VLDDTLWTIARAQMPEEVQARAHELMEKNSRGVITDDEHAELETLVAHGDQCMLMSEPSWNALPRSGRSVPSAMLAAVLSNLTSILSRPPIREML